MLLDFIADIYVYFSTIAVNLYLSLQSFIGRCFPDYTKEVVTKVMRAGGITVNGKNPWDITVKEEQFYWHLSSHSSLGFGESYIKGWIECDDLQELCVRLFHPKIRRAALSPTTRLLNYMLYRFWNIQTKERSREVAKKHYDLGNELYEVMLDPTLSYSCGYWKNAKNLHEAQIAKMDLIARKLKLKPGMRVLDIGSGWGSLAKYLAENYDVEVIGYNISEEQIKYSRDICRNLKVEIRDADYRDIEERFDRIVSVGMFEHVGEHNYRTFFEICNRCLTDEGIFLLHTIGVNHADCPLTEPFALTYVFPNSALPYYQHITAFSEGSFIIEDWHNFSFDYTKTLDAWYKNFVAGWPKIADKYGDEFFRLWTFYLCIARAAFVNRRTQVWQITFSKDGLRGGYESVR